MRQVRQQKSSDSFKIFEYTPIALGPLADFLDTSGVLGGLHIENVYFGKDGHYYFQAHPYNGKFYSRIEKENVMDHNTSKMVRKLVNKPEREIDKTMTAEEIIEMVYEWREKHGKQIPSTDDNGNKIMIWVEDENKDQKIEKTAKKNTNK